MGKICRGGFFDGMPCYTREDANTCVSGGGHVEETGSGPSCAATSLATGLSQDSSGLPFRGGIAELAVTPFRHLRTIARNHPLVQELVTLNREGAAEIERLAMADSGLRDELTSAFVALAHLVEAVTAPESGDAVYTPELHEKLSLAVQHFGERSSTAAVQRSIDRIVELADSFVGLTAKDIGDRLKNEGSTKTPRDSAKTRPITASFSSSAIVDALQHRSIATSLAEALRITPSIGRVLELSHAVREIEAKAASLGALAGPATGDTEEVPGGFRRTYQGCDIYYNPSAGAHEIHGDIRAKYNAVNGVLLIGLPVTDETGTPDGVGRYNHFEKNGSIYWTSNTGPMVVRGPVRNRWANQGWELGPLGYPVADHRTMPGLYPNDHPDIAWSIFQNGAIFSKGNAVDVALAAEVSPDALKGMIRSFFDRRLKAADGDLGLEAPVDVLAISGWTYGFWGSRPRMITFRLHGFHDNGILPDSTFEIEIRLRFSLTWGLSFTYPTSVTLTAAMDWLKVHASGLGSGQLSQGIFDGVKGAFFRGGPDPQHWEVPDGAVFITSMPTGADQTGSGNLDLIDVMLTAQGGLQVLVNPLPPSFGALRRLIAQNTIDSFLENV